MYLMIRLILFALVAFLFPLLLPNPNPQHEHSIVVLTPPTTLIIPGVGNPPVSGYPSGFI